MHSSNWYTKSQKEARTIADYMAGPYGGFFYVSIRDVHPSDMVGKTLVQGPEDWL